MGLYYLPLLIRSDRYFVAKLESDAIEENRELVDFNFVVPCDDRVLTPLLTIEDPSRVVLNQMDPSGGQDIPLQECHISLQRVGEDFELLIRHTGSFRVDAFRDDEKGILLDYSESQKRLRLAYYRHRVMQNSFYLHLRFLMAEGDSYTGRFQFATARAADCQRVVIDFGSEASQVAYRNCGPQASVQHYDILENIMSRLGNPVNTQLRREDFLNNESGQSSLYRSFYAIKRTMGREQREKFPFNFTDDLANDELRLYITRQEVGVSQLFFHDHYSIIPNLKLGMEKSIQLSVEGRSEDYSTRTHQRELISAILLRMLRLMITTKPEFRKGGLIVTLLVPNIYTQHEVFGLLNELRQRTPDLRDSLGISAGELNIEYETISESDAAFMGYQQTKSSEVRLANGEMALVIDCGKGTTDISMLLADDNQNYSSFFRTGFAGAGNVLSYGFAEDFLTLVLRAIPGGNDLSVPDFTRQHILEQNLTVEVLNFLQLIEDQKRRYRNLQVVGINEFAHLSERSQSTERRIGTLHRDRSTLLQYAWAILEGRNLRWDDEITGLITKATQCIVQGIIGSIRDVVTRDIQKRIKVVMLSGRAFYFEELKTTLQAELRKILEKDVAIHTVAPGRSINNKNVAIHGAFSGAYKITDFTGIPIDKKEGLARNRDVINNNLFLYRGIKIEPGNDIIYNTSLVRRNNQQLKPFRNRAIDIYFTRDNIYLRLMENQRVKEVCSLYSVLSSISEVTSPVRDLRSISMFPNHPGDLPSISIVHEDMMKEIDSASAKPVARPKGILQLFQF